MSEVARALAVVVGLAVTAGTGACDSLGPADDELEIHNESGDSVVVIALTAETAARADPALTVQVDQYEDRLIEPGGVLRLPTADIVGEWDADQGLVLFLYRVEGDTGSFAGAKQVSDAELDDAGGRVTIESGDVGTG